MDFIVALQVTLISSGISRSYVSCISWTLFGAVSVNLSSALSWYTAN